MEKTHKITIKNMTYITPLQVDGPIVAPMPVSENIVRDLIRRGYSVYEKVNGINVRLDLLNYKDPARATIKKNVPPTQTTSKPAVSEKRFEKQAPVIPQTPDPTPKLIEEPKNTSKPVEYDFGKEVTAVDTSIAPDEEAVGRLFTGRPIPDVSPTVEAISEVDLAQEGTVEAGKYSMEETLEKSSDNEEVKSSNTNNNTSNRLQNKRKHKR